MYNFNHLYYFFVTAKSGGVSNAAKYLHISQPSLSAQLKILESSMNKKLFAKKGRNLVLTPDGERTFAYCKKMFSVAEEMSTAFKSQSSHLTQRIHVGISDQVERTFIADILSPLLKDRRIATKNTFAVTSAQDAALLDSLRRQELDLILTNRPAYGEDLTELVSISMPVQLMISSENMKSLRLRISRNTSLVDFMQAIPEGMVLPAESIKLRQETDIFFQEIKFRKPIVFESDILSVVGRAILDGAGFGFLPTPYFYEEIKHGQITPFGPKQGFWKHMLYVIVRKQENYDPVISEIKRYIKDIEKMS